MLIERNQVLIGIIAVVLLLAATAFAVGLSGGAFKAGIPLKAQFTDAAGLEAGDFVFVAGVRTGEVDTVEIVKDHVEVDFRLDTEASVPSDSIAVIFLSNTLGKRAIKVVPGDPDSPPLQEGNEVGSVESNRTPVDFPELGDETVELLGGTDVEALQEVTTAVADITEGLREDVADLLDGVERITRVISERRTELADVIDRAHVVIDAAAQKDQEIVAIIDDFAVVLDTLVRRRSDVERLLRETAATSDIAADLVEDRRAQIDRVLDELAADLQIIDRHQVDLAHVFAYAGVAVDGFASIGYSGGPAKLDNPAWGNVFTTSLGNVGIEALFGCGGDLDRLLTEILGPDPNCDGTQETPPEGTANGSVQSSDSGADDGLGFRRLFSVALALREVRP
ncbi:MAG: MCE family protein [Actinobacteria bacterium]|nr:MCE family protein [Actinomycetota bacterium]